MLARAAPGKTADRPQNASMARSFAGAFAEASCGRVTRAGQSAHPVRPSPGRVIRSAISPERFRFRCVVWSEHGQSEGRSSANLTNTASGCSRARATRAARSALATLLPCSISQNCWRDIACVWRMSVSFAANGTGRLQRLARCVQRARKHESRTICEEATRCNGSKREGTRVEA